MSAMTVAQPKTRQPLGKLLRLSTAAVALAALPTLAHADYRLVFIADGFGTAVGVPGTAFYNQNAAFAASGLAISPSILDQSNLQWSAIVSTTGSSAIQNLDSVCDATCQSLPIYDINGTEIAPNQAALFSDPSAAISIDQDGDSYAGDVWTGSTSSGTASTGNEVDSVSGYTEVGLAGSISEMFDAGIAEAQVTDGFNNYLPFYAISNEISTAVPEPASAALLLGGMVVTGVFRRRRRS